MRRGAIKTVAVGDYPTGVQLAGGAYAASTTLAAPPAAANSTTYGVYPQQIPAIASDVTPDNSTTAVVPQTTLGATNSSVPANSSSPLSGGTHTCHLAVAWPSFSCSTVPVVCCILTSPD